METHLFLFADVFVEDLEHELGDQGLYMLLVLVLCVNPFSVHLTHIGLILIAEVVHSADQVVPLVGEVLELLIKGQFVLAVLDLLASEVL